MSPLRLEVMHQQLGSAAAVAVIAQNLGDPAVQVLTRIVAQLEVAVRQR